MTEKEIKNLAEKIRALEPQTQDIVLRYLDLLKLAQQTGQAVPATQAAND